MSRQTNGTDRRPPYGFGAVMRADGDVRFRLWAPGQDKVLLDIPDLGVHMMRRHQDGMHEVVVACEAGTRYCYRFPDGGTMPDPASRRQDGDVDGFSCVVDPRDYIWRHDDWTGLPWEETVMMEVHAGLAGGFEGVRAKLAEWSRLGINAVELMPLADFPGSRNWGYDGVLPFAPDEAYGTPNQLKNLIDDAHGLGMQVFLDVVYNHFGPEGNHLFKRVPEFFREDIRTPWGPAIDFRQPAVRAFFTENALYWLRDYRFDGLRIDAAHAISERDWLPEMAAVVRKALGPRRQIHLVLENDNNDAELLGEGFDAQWNDDAHHVIHHLLTGESDGYYAAYVDDPTDKLRRALSEGFVYQGEPCSTRAGQPRGSSSADLAPSAFVFFLQNHDQTGNRAFGERLRAMCQDNTAALSAVTGLQLLAPFIPLVFMGEERGSIQPFLYFTDFRDAGLVDAINRGRRKEFREFLAYKDRREANRHEAPVLPEPNAESTWHASDPYAEPCNQAVWDQYQQLLRVRREFITPFLKGARSQGAYVVGHAAIVARWCMGNGALLSLYCNLSDADCDLGDTALHISERAIWCSVPLADSALHAGRILAATTVATVVVPESLQQHHLLCKDAPWQ